MSLAVGDGSRTPHDGKSTDAKARLFDYDDATVSKRPFDMWQVRKQDSELRFRPALWRPAGGV